MRFSTFAIIAIAIPPTVEAFGVPRPSTSRKQASPVLAASDPYDFSLSTEGNKPKSIKKNKAKIQPIPDPEPKPELEPNPKPESEPLKPKKEKKTQKMKKEKSPEPALDDKKSKNELVEVKSAPFLEAPDPNEKVTKDVNAITTGVALGTAPLVVAPIIALTVARSTLSKTKARRDEIAAEIAAFEASEAKRLAKKSTDVDIPTLAKAIAFLGAGGASIGLILAAPFSNGNIPEVNKVPSVPREYAFSASIKKSKIETSPKTFIGSPKKSASPDGYNFELSPEAFKTGKPSVNSKKGDFVAKAKEEAATKAFAKAKEKASEKADTAEKAAVAKAKEEKEAAAKAAVAKAKEKDDTAAKAAAAEKAAVAKAQEKEEAAAKAAAEKATAEKSAAEKAAVAKAREEADAKAAAEKAAVAKAMEKEEAAVKAAAEKAAAKITSDTQEKELADSANAENIVRKNAAPVGVVKGGEEGGKVLPKEGISAETLDFLQKYKK